MPNFPDFAHLPHQFFMGNVIESFTLSTSNYWIAGKGLLYTGNSKLTTNEWIDFDERGILGIGIYANHAGKKMRITFELYNHVTRENPKGGSLKIHISDNLSTIKEDKLYSLPSVNFLVHEASPYGLVHTIISEKFDAVSPLWITCTFPNAIDVLIKSVRVDIYEPLQIFQHFSGH